MVCTHGGWFQGFQSAGCKLAASHAGQRVDPRYSLLLFRAFFEHVESAKSKTIVVSITMVIFDPYVTLTSAKRLCIGFAREWRQAHTLKRSIGEVARSNYRKLKHLYELVMITQTFTKRTVTSCFVYRASTLLMQQAKPRTGNRNSPRQEQISVAML